MARPAAIQRARAKRLRASPSGEISLRRPADDEGAATVRNVIPWRKVEEQLAKRLAEKAAAGEDVGDYTPDPSSGEVEVESALSSDSGVRASLPDAAESARRDKFPPELDHDRDRDLMRPLTYSVYTVSELDTREVQALRMTVAPPPEPQVIGWKEVENSAAAVLRAVRTWHQRPSPRPRLGDFTQVPFAALTSDLGHVLRRLPWKKITLGALAAIGAMLVFLIGIIVVAELTDDLKPTRTAALDMPAAPPASPVAKAARPAAPAAAVASPAIEVDDVVELDDVSPAAAPAAAAAAAKKPAPKTKPKLRK